MDTAIMEKTYLTGGRLTCLKAEGDEARVGGYLVAFGNEEDRDAHGEYFTPDTELGLDWYGEVPVLYHHGLDRNVQSTVIGKIVRMVKDTVGVYAEAVLDLTQPFARAVLQLIERGVLGWSSGSMPHLVKVTAGGHILEWPIAEGSLTPSPAETAGRTTVQALRAALKTLTETFPASAVEVLSDPKEPAAKGGSAGRAGTLTLFRHIKRGVTHMDANVLIPALEAAGLDETQIVAVMKELGAAESAEPTPTEPAELPEDAVMAEGEDTAPAIMAAGDPSEDEVKTEPAAVGKAQPLTAKQVAAIVAQGMKAVQRIAPASKRLPGVQADNPAAVKSGSPRIEMYSKWRDLSAEDMSFMAMGLRLQARKTGAFHDPMPTEFYREMFDKARKGLAAKTLDLDVSDANRLVAIKDNELDNTGVAAAAGNWVPTLWSSDLWRRVRVDNDVARQFRVVEMPSKSYELPIESTDPTVYKVPETTNEAQLTLAASGNPIPDSVLAASKTTLTAVKMGLRVGFSAEQEEDSIIPFIPQLREQALRSIQDAIDNVLLNGDTETGASTNINIIDGTAAATAKYMVFNGLRKLALVTNTAMSLDAGDAAPTLQKIRQLRFLMRSATNVYANRPQDLAIFVDVPTYGAMLNIDELLVFMNNGRGSTVNDGVLPTIDGTPVYASAELILADANGKVNTAQDGTKGQLIIAAKPAWYIGYRRQVMSSIDFLPYYDSYQMTATVRLAFINKDTVASAVLYNLNV